MSHIGNRQPVYFRDRSNSHSTGLRFDRLSKADWADVYCDLYRQVFGEQSSSEEMMKDAERRVKLLKAWEIR